jgi:putative DNA primase/helicase
MVPRLAALDTEHIVNRYPHIDVWGNQRYDDVSPTEPDPGRDLDADDRRDAEREPATAPEPGAPDPDYSPEALEHQALEHERQLDAEAPVIDIDIGTGKPAAIRENSAKSVVWEAPQPLPEQQFLPVPRFNSDLLPVDIRPWTTDIAERMQVAPDLVAVAAMAALGVVAANARTIHPKRYDSWRVYPNLWGAAVALPGSMKTPAASSVERVLNKLEEQERELHKRRLVDAQADEMISDANHKALKAKLEGSAKGRKDAQDINRHEIVEALRKLSEDQKERPHLRRLKASDTTIEALIDRVQRGNRRCAPIVIWRDELLSLLKSFDRDGHEGDRAQLMEGWGVATITVDRMSRGTLYVKDFAVSIFGCVTPGGIAAYVREATEEGAGADGFLQRLQLLVYPDPLPTWTLVDRTPDRVAEQRAFAMYERLYALDQEDEHGKPPALRFDPEAQNYFDAWLTNLEHRLRDHRVGWDTEARRSHFSKYRSLMPAIALLSHLASGEGTEDQQVTQEAAHRAAQWCEYLEAHAERVYAMTDRSIESILVDKIASGKLAGVVSVRDLHRRHFAGRKADDVHEALEELGRLGWLRLQTEKTRGRPRETALINPLAVRR